MRQQQALQAKECVVKIAPVAARICGRIAECLGTGPASVSVKGKTREGLGPVGRGEAIEAHAVVLLKRL